jgi:hypothetical protein
MTLRHEAAATCLSWIPPTAVQGVFSLPFGLGIAHYDQPPPDELPDVEALLAADAIRFANQLHAWIEVEDGRITSHGTSGQGQLGFTTVRLRSHGLTFAGVALPNLVPPVQVQRDGIVFTQTAGSHTGAPVPRPVTRPPFRRLAAPLAWTTITLTLRADGTSAARLAAARHPSASELQAAPGAVRRRALKITTPRACRRRQAGRRKSAGPRYVSGRPAAPLSR